jgi:hypothetical protein
MNRKELKNEKSNRSILGEALHRSVRPSSISLEIGIERVFSKKQTSIFYLGKSISQKKPQGYQLFDFPQFLHHAFFDNLMSFYCRSLCFESKKIGLEKGLFH